VSGHPAPPPLEPRSLRLDAEHRDTAVDERTEQVAVVARDLHDEALAVEAGRR
jgi:hypothetical protein